VGSSPTQPTVFTNSVDLHSAGNHLKPKYLSGKDLRALPTEGFFTTHRTQFTMTTAAEPAWQITPEKVQAVVQRLIQIGRPKKIILFGSYIRGDPTRDSDLDVLVVTGDEVESPRRESVRLRSSVSDINMPMDILVVPYSRFEALREKLGLIYREADRRGKVVYES
jgi:predicted nucleotidyltransferase